MRLFSNIGQNIDQIATQRYLGVVGIILLTCSAILGMLRNVISQVVNLYPISLPLHPYFVPDHGGLLYVAAPAVVLSAIILILAPGVLLLLVFSHTRSITELFLKGFALSLIIHVAGNAAFLKIGPALNNREIFLWYLLGINLIVYAILAVQLFRGKLDLAWIGERQQLRRLGWFFLIPILISVLMVPVIYWQDLNGDGVEALLLGRSLSEFSFPRYPSETGVIGLGLGLIPQTYVTNWFIQLFGALDGAARLPVLLYTPLLFFGLICLVEWQNPRCLSFREEAVIFLGLSVFLVAMGYNSSYELYFADLASPTGQVMLLIVFMVGMVYFLWTREWVWFIIFSLLGLFSWLMALLLLVLLGFAVFIAARENRKQQLVMVLSSLVVCMLVMFVYERIYVPKLLAGSSPVLPAGMHIARLRYLRFDDFQRLLYLIVPCGILPCLALILYPRQDTYGRTVTLVILFYFAFFYIVAFYALHHFAPIMVFPLVVFYRIMLRYPEKRALQISTAIAAIIALGLSLPRDFSVNRIARQIGHELSYEIGKYNGNYDEYIRALEPSGIQRVNDLFGELNRVADPTRELSVSSWSLIHYASQPKQAGQEINYLVQPSGATVPPGFTLVAQDERTAVYVKVIPAWHARRDHPPRTDFRSPVYDIPREQMYAEWGVPAKNYDLDLFEYLSRLFGPG